mmetsp:Transcript_56580/g.143166  ORF Transcript_56580/g.143166 Transcript_56580/m.143166 type:complete len:222 (-) Transcript_56580:60-725(-)
MLWGASGQHPLLEVVHGLRHLAFMQLCPIRGRHVLLGLVAVRRPPLLGRGPIRVPRRRHGDLLLAAQLLLQRLIVDIGTPPLAENDVARVYGRFSPVSIIFEQPCARSLALLGPNDLVATTSLRASDPAKDLQATVGPRHDGEWIHAAVERDDPSFHREPAHDRARVPPSALQCLQVELPRSCGAARREESGRRRRRSGDVAPRRPASRCRRRGSVFRQLF